MRPHYLRGFNFPGSRRAAERILTKPGFLGRLRIRVQILALRYRIWSTEDWIKDCERDGITDSLNMREFRRDLGRMRCQRAMLEARL